jgi:hypothetical protein
MVMRRQTRHHLLLLTAAAVLGSIACFQPYHEETGSARALTKLDPEQIRLVDIEIDGNEPVRLRRHGEDWFLDGPVPVAAESDRIRSVLHLLTAPSELYYPLLDPRGAAYGLDRPRLRLKLDGEELIFGDTAPISGLRYVRSGDTLHLMRDSLYPQLAAGRLGLVRRTILPPNVKIRRLVLPALSIERNAIGNWITEPRSDSLNPDAIHGLLQRWRRARALHVAAGRRAAGTAAVRIELEGNAQPIELRIAQTETTLILVRPDWGLEYHFPVSAAEQLLGQPPPDPQSRRGESQPRSGL